MGLQRVSRAAIPAPCGNCCAVRETGWRRPSGPSRRRPVKKGAEQENPRAQSKLGWIYLKGLGVKPDTRKAILWYKEAAEQGYAHAQYTLGLIYRNGSGINVNHYESQKWLKLAAKQHYKNAERLLAGLPAH